MKQIKIRDREFNIPTEWMDTTIGQYIEICKLGDNKDEYVDYEYLLKTYSILCNMDYDFLLRIKDYELNEAAECIKEMASEGIKPIDIRKIMIGDVLYSFENPESLTNGEKASIQILEKDTKYIYEQWLNVLTVMIRPAVMKLDEFGEIYYEVDECNINRELLFKRKQAFMDIPSPIAMYVVNSFMNAKE